MEFKIDTRNNYTLIRPLKDRLDANMAASLADQCTDVADGGSPNYLIDLSACQEAEELAFETLAQLHERCYEGGQSLVFTGLQEGVLTAIREAQMEDAINIAPTEAEAIDIINMEILERDLLGEE